MGIKKVSDKKFRVRVTKRHPISRRRITRTKTAKSLAEARKYEHDLLLKVGSALNKMIYPNFSSMIEKTILELKEQDLSLKTINDYNLTLNKHCSHWKDRLINEITTQEIRCLVKDGLSHLSQSSQKNVLKAIRHVFKTALEQKFIISNPVPEIKFKFQNKITTVLTKEQISHLLRTAKNMDHEYYPIWVTALYTGMRSGELYALRWRNVSLKKRQILICESWNNKDGFKSTKSGDDRIVPINDELLKVLNNLKLQSRANEFVLPRIKTWKQGLQAIELRKLLIGINIPPVRFHDLRASWCTALLSNGIEPVKVMKMGGWSDLKTLQIYLRKAGIDTEGATDSLNFHDPNARKQKEVLKINSIYA